MSESSLMWVLAGTLLNLSIFVWFYVLGGRDNTSKAYRRFLAGFLFPIGCLLLAAYVGRISPWMLLSVVAYPAALTIGYGANKVWAKLRRRALYGFALGAAGLPILVILMPWWVSVFHLGLAMAVSIFWGILNPTSAVGEEGIIGLLSVVLVAFSVVR